MAKEVVYKVKEAEDASSEAVRRANEEAKRILADAEKDGNERCNAMLREARLLRDEMIREAAKEAEEESVPLGKKTAGEIERILNPERERFEKAVAAITERIVNRLDNGNE